MERSSSHLRWQRECQNELSQPGTLAVSNRLIFVCDVDRASMLKHNHEADIDFPSELKLHTK